MTNADVIRRMTDDELYEFLSEWECGDIDYAVTFCDLCKGGGNELNLDCDGCRKHWLTRNAVEYGGLFYWKRNKDFTDRKTEPQTDCGDFADRLAYERGVKHAWEVAQKVFDSTVTFYEAEDLAKQIDKDINVRSKTEPQTEQVRCGHYTCHNYEACKKNGWQGCVYEPVIVKTEPQTDCPQSNICGKPCKECGACEEECGLWKKLKDELQTERRE